MSLHEYRTLGSSFSIHFVFLFPDVRERAASTSTVAEFSQKQNRAGESPLNPISP